MYIQFNRVQKSISAFEYNILERTPYSVCETIGFEKTSFGTISLKGQLKNTKIQLNINSKFGNRIQEGAVYKELCGDFSLDNRTGSIFYCGKKGSNFLNGIYFWSFVLNGEIYNTYEVGFGRKGIYLCVWKDDQLIAIISKKTHTKKFESNYSIYAENCQDFEFLIVINAYWDISRYFISSSGEEWHTLNTWQKELKNKYDTEFIPRIKAMDGITD